MHCGGGECCSNTPIQGKQLFQSFKRSFKNLEKYLIFLDQFHLQGPDPQYRAGSRFEHFFYSLKIYVRITLTPYINRCAAHTYRSAIDDEAQQLWTTQRRSTGSKEIIQKQYLHGSPSEGALGIPLEQLVRFCEGPAASARQPVNKVINTNYLSNFYSSFK